MYTGVVWVGLLLVLVRSAEGVRGRSQARLCPPSCDLRTCDVEPAEPCEKQGGRMIKDRCDCCPVCRKPKVNTSRAAEPVKPGPSMPAACNKIKCSGHQMCVLNIQGIPMCRCPGALYCKRRKRDRNRVCGRDGITYKSRCYLQITECTQNTRIGVSQQGRCPRKTKRHRGGKNGGKERKGKSARRSKQQVRRERQRERRRKKKLANRLMSKRRRSAPRMTQEERRRRRRARQRHTKTI